MKIALVSTFVPFVKGGYRNIVEWLEHVLRDAGHQVEVVYLPEVDEPALLFQQMAAFRWVDLSSADRVICFRPQAHLVQHPHKILWFIHHIRGFYDLWDNDVYRGCPDDETHRGFRKALHETDTAAILEARQVFTNSKVVAERLRRFNNADSEVLYPPVFQPERFFCRSFNDEIVYVCRLENHKRQFLLIEALARTKTPVRVRICGTSSDPAHVAELRAQIASLGIQQRVILEDRWISEEEKIEILADCLAAAYLPEDEDSYGYPSIEASHASKAIITTSDSGGVLELVVDGVNGFVCEPNAEAIARVMDKLFNDRHLAKTLGANAHDRLDEIKISWSHVIERLLA